MEIPFSDLELRARALNINDISGFLASGELTSAGFIVDRRKKLLIRDV